MARMGDFVIPILTSTQLDQYIWAASKALINVLWHIIHPILHPQHSWKSGRASIRRWYGLPTKSPLSYIAFDMTKNIDDGVSESYFPTSYINYSIPPMVLKVWNHLIQGVMSFTPQTLYQIQAEYWWSDFRVIFHQHKYIIPHHPPQF